MNFTLVTSWSLPPAGVGSPAIPANKFGGACEKPGKHKHEVSGLGSLAFFGFEPLAEPFIKQLSSGLTGFELVFGLSRGGLRHKQRSRLAASLNSASALIVRDKPPVRGRSRVSDHLWTLRSRRD